MEQIRLAAQSALELTLRAMEAEKQQEKIDLKTVKEIVSILKTLSDLGLGEGEQGGTGVVMMPRVREDG